VISKGKAAREKGKRFEREVATIFRIAGVADDPHRGWQARDGSDAPDVVGLDGWWPECKHRDRINILAAYEQAVTESQGRAKPLVISRKTGGRILCTVGIADFMELLVVARRAAGESAPSTPQKSEGCDDEQCGSCEDCPTTT